MFVRGPKAMMETQDDSIDIARLQRVALGLESITSQPFFNELRATGHSPQGRRDPVTLPQLDGPSSTPASQDVAPLKSLVHKAPGAAGKYHNDTGLLNTDRQLPTRTSLPFTSGPRSAKMGSADELPSDTQVISQSVYDEILRKNKEAGNDGPGSNVVDQAALMTLHEGDSGHIDLFAGFDGTNIQAPNTDENDDQSSSKLGESSPLVYESNIFPESQRFVAKTPVTATKQHHVEAVATVSPLVSRNPLAPDLESTSGVLALSQVFKATQAPSSPLLNGLQSDLMSDRPSPNIPIQSRPIAPSLSSPFNNLAASFPRDSSEMQLNYVTMNESQANRDNILKERMTRSADHIYSEDQSDGEFDREPSFIERMRRQRRIDQETAAQFATLSAPARQSSRGETQTGKAISPPGAPERGGSVDNSITAVLEEPHEPTSELQTIGISEEETEQEEEMLEPAARSQVPNSSIEEDKENCNDLSAVSLPHAASAHDRLSQALYLHESPLPNNGEPIQTFSAAHSHIQSQDANERPVDAIRSSPITVVKDSQRSPGRNDEERSEQETIETPRNRRQTRRFGSQSPVKPTTGQGQGQISPFKQVAVQSPAPGSQQHDDPFHSAHITTFPRARASFRNPVRSPSSSHEDYAAQQTGVTHCSNSVTSNGIDNGDRASLFDPRGKSSSMPSRVAETPVYQRQRSSNDLLPSATIPETSPNQMNNQGWMSDLNNETADQEDDDLPPLYPQAFERGSQSQPVMSESSSPVKNLLNSKILSSPSGRQRRALTEIAADASPQAGGSAFDVNINILSADDQEFRSAIAMSPVPPHKKRRGNDGRSIPASDPIVPVTPRAHSHPVPAQEEEEAVIAQPPQHKEPVSRPQSTFPGRSRPPRRAESIWDTEDSPKFRVSSKERSKIFARSLARERQTPRPQEPGPKETSQPAAFETAQETICNAIPEVPSSEPVVVESPADRGQQPPAESALVAPNQVFAPWSGQKRAYYPATCFGKSFENLQDRYLVKFEDSAPVEVPIGAVKRLELRIGDAVKVDMPNVPKVTHIIRGFAERLNAGDLSREATTGAIPVTDMYGHSTVTLGPKQRKSLPSGGLAGPDTIITVPISRIYLDTILWNQLKDRSFTCNSGSATSESRLWTPSDRQSTPASPSTRLSRSFRLSNGLFSGMVFAVSYGDKSDAKFRITKMILENDGKILEDGFNELFDLPFNAPLATPTKSPAPQPAEDNVNLRLKTSVEEVGFACLIADKHSRRPKYMQALALNLPCLSDRWVEDCVTKGQVLDWAMYLLPAGESSYLNGATKSRILTPYPATRARLFETVAARPNLLNGKSVLLVTGRNGKADEKRRKAYIFLTYALGASKIERVPDIKSARTVLNQSQTGEKPFSWDWIYIDDDDKAATKAMAVASSVPSKRRRKSKLMDSINGDELGLDSSVRIVGNEFVCQSLILGRLVDH